ncbi:hypothetical protein NX059_003542 [Plenodomus lindquistii]|nr:hypothetical protein NX059_003542 [Plenodomus lindquistii]
MMSEQCPVCQAKVLARTPAWSNQLLSHDPAIYAEEASKPCLNYPNVCPLQTSRCIVGDSDSSSSSSSEEPTKPPTRPTHKVPPDVIPPSHRCDGMNYADRFCSQMHAEARMKQDIATQEEAEKAAKAQSLKPHHGDSSNADYPLDVCSGRECTVEECPARQARAQEEEEEKAIEEAKAIKDAIKKTTKKKTTKNHESKRKTRTRVSFSPDVVFHSPIRDSDSPCSPVVVKTVKKAAKGAGIKKAAKGAGIKKSVKGARVKKSVKGARVKKPAKVESQPTRHSPRKSAYKPPGFYT